jgi:hypothetical protein
MEEKTIREVALNGTRRYDDDGRPISDIATCGHCGQSWDDAIVTSLTPAPSGRCPFEDEHVDEEDEDSDKDDHTYLRVAVANEIERLIDSRGAENAPFGGWRDTAVHRIAVRERMNPYTLDRILREDQTPFACEQGCGREFSEGCRQPDCPHTSEIDAPVYPERFGTMTAVMLDSETLETITIALMEKQRRVLDDTYSETRQEDLAAIDRACRALGIES